VATLVKAGALVVDCRPLYDAPASWQRGASAHEHELATFVARRMGEVYGKRLSKVDAHAITRLVGTDLGALDTALRTLALYVGDAPGAGPEDIHAALGRTRNDPAWRLTDAVADGDAPRALELLEAALARGVPDGRGALVSSPDALFMFVGAALFSTWRRLLAGAEALALGEDAAQAARAQGVPPFKVEAFLDQCRAHDVADLLVRSGAFLEAELGVKGGTTPARVALERLVVRLTVPREARSGSGVGGRS
jgi:DNA polymerase III delta subunit